MGKLPYIPDKDLYMAVIGACSYIRETGYFNKATEYYARKYGVDADEVKRYVRIAQGNGQREAAKRQKRVYKWYAAVIMLDYVYINDLDFWDSDSSHWDADEKMNHCYVTVIRATSLDNAKNALHYKGLTKTDFFEPHDEWKVIYISEHKTKEEADNAKKTFTLQTIMNILRMGDAKCT